jgi:ectoine hydroxylase-related dioxygenase (phytanoyl-CoA dioxygenase family)
MSIPRARSTDPNWLTFAVEALRDVGCALVTDVLPHAFVERTRHALYEAREGILRDVGPDRLRAAGEIGTLRLPMKYDRHFFSFLEIPEVLQFIDATVGPTAILHLQNGFILPPALPGGSKVFQTTFHRDFPRYMNGYVASVNAFFAIDEFTRENGATLLVPGSHRQPQAPGADYMARVAVAAEAPAGAMLLFDSTIWHAAGENVSGRDRLAINHQFTRSFFKQQIDYVRALGDAVVSALPPRSQQLLGWYTRVVTSLDEYYRPEAERLYRKGQG